MRLKNKNAGESMEIYVSDRKLWSITKDYDNASFDKNDSSLGYKISVYQDSINQTFSEYLVNYDFFIETMEKYGFKIISLEDAKKMYLDLIKNSEDSTIKRSYTKLGTEEIIDHVNQGIKEFNIDLGDLRSGSNMLRRFGGFNR